MRRWAGVQWAGLLLRGGRVRALGLWAVAWAGSGCSLGESDVFTIYPDGGGECWVDEDCPRVDCYEAPSCTDGMCRVLAQPRPTICSIGVCTEDAVCVPCAADADCERVNQNECYALVCGNEGICLAEKLPKDSPCLQSVGRCNDGATCIAPD